ncbi:MAG: DUF1501 domain-containing protein, partial [Verrucomicrobiae bacterium]|nr:DUF1501 domain-containing protein [Verrucomicrobiae bacterium]
LGGGNDAFNTLIPRDSRHAEYSVSRSNLALAINQLLPLNQLPDGDGMLYGFHPSLTGLQELFNGYQGDSNKRRLAVVANIGTLLEPTTKASYLNESVGLPKALFSHSDQQQQWQTSVPQGMNDLSGWGGRMADILHSAMNTGLTSMSISLNGNNVFQTGQQTHPFVITPSGALVFEDGRYTWPGGDHPFTIKNDALRSALEEEHQYLVRQAFKNVLNESIESQAFYQSVYESFDESGVNFNFGSTNYMEQQLGGALKAIALREQLGLRRQTIFVEGGNFDNHLELLNTHSGELQSVNDAIYNFQSGLETLGLADSVVTILISEFGRTLRSNGRGTDHAWGGNAMVVGGPVAGGRIYGKFPSLALDGPDDIGRGGLLVPSTSVDEFYAEILQWFGVSNTDIPYVLPNISNFYSLGSGPPIGFLSS